MFPLQAALALKLLSPPVGTTATQIPVAVVEDLANLRASVDALTNPLLSAKQGEFEATLDRIATSAELRTVLREMALLSSKISLPSGEHIDFDQMLEDYVRVVGSTDLRSRVRQALNLSLELALRAETILDPQELERSRREFGTALDSIDAEEFRMLGRAAISWLTLTVASTTDKQMERWRAEILLEAWEMGYAQALREMDPIQDQLESALEMFPEDLRQHVYRITYVPNPSEFGGSDLTVYIVIRDGAPVRPAELATNHRVRTAIGFGLSWHFGGDRGYHAAVRAISASEAGPAETRMLG